MPAEVELSPRGPRNSNEYHEELGDVQRDFAIHSIPLPTQDHAQQQQGIASFSLLDALQADERPSFVIDTSSGLPEHLPVELVYTNPALSGIESLLSNIRQRGSTSVVLAEANSAFRRWLFGHSEDLDAACCGNAYTFEGYIWSATVLGQYRIISGVQSFSTHAKPASSVTSKHRPSLSIDPREHREPMYLPQFVESHLPTVPAPAGVPQNTKIGRETSPSVAVHEHRSFDCTMELSPANLSSHLSYFRSIDWEQTPLGAMRTWSPQLRCVVNMMMNDQYPAVLFWGDHVTMIYNEAYIEIIGVLHPCMGKSARVAASEYWGLFQPLVDHLNATGESLTEHDMPLFLDRHGFLEETFFSFQFVPILDSGGTVAGYYQPLLETTQNNILERRVSSLVEIGSQTAKARDLQTYWDLVLNTLAINDKDVPFALLYAVEHETGPDISSVSSPGSALDIERCVLKGSIGADVGHAIAPTMIHLGEGTNVFIPSLWKAARSRRPTLVHFEELDVPESVLASISWKGYGDPCRCVVVCPLLPTTSEQVLGFLILGVNPRRPFDVEYQQFVHVMNRLLGTSLASVVLFDEEIRQKENAIGQAARIQEQLLAEIQDKEQKFQRFAERADIAIFIMDPKGSYTYRNQRWFDIFTLAANIDDVATAWKEIVFPEDITYCEGLFTKLAIEKVPITFELKTNMHWDPPGELSEDSAKHHVWILCSAYPEIGKDGDLIEIVGNVTDISKQKWAEGEQKKRTDSALESKNHLEHFIDTTSHEMRNPLSAIMQCADGIISSYTVQAGEDCTPPSPSSYSSLLDQTLDAAQTIANCSLHMKRVVDDILTVSKLDTGLLVITPVDAQPEMIVNHAVKMFRPEAEAAEVDMQFVVNQSYRDHQVNWVSVDPTRLLQVLINLITNAVKFTRLEATRKITVSIGASATPPSSQLGDLQYIDTKLVGESRQLRDDWKQGPQVYLIFNVSDTGRGLSQEEKATLFARFSQASPRTHIHYGGSGLGLFISRRLTEMQGGAIGLASEPKKGSTFSFYIKARRTTSDARRGSLPHMFPEDIRHRPQTRSAINKLHRPVTLTRRQSTIHSAIPIEALGHEAAGSAFEELKRTKSIPETLHVLIVEDNLVNQKVLAKQLRKLGCQVSVANHGVEALEFLKTTKHWDSTNGSRKHETTCIPSSAAAELSLILMDWEMPIMNGLTCVAKIRELEQSAKITKHIPVIGVTANVRQQQINTAMDAGMDDVVAKPFRVAELLGRMKSVIAGTTA